MTTTLRINDELKRESDAILKQLGLPLSTAITLFLKQVVRTGGIPFPLKADVPNQETRDVLDRYLDGKEPLYGPFQSADEMMDAILTKDLGNA